MSTVGLIFQKVLDGNRAWRARNPERHRVMQRRAERAYRERYPLRAIVKEHRRVARRRGCVSHWSEEQALKALAYFGGRCAVCESVLGTGREAHWDHWIPWRSDACPGTVPTNMIPLCRSCNLSKNATLPEDWLRSQHPERADAVLARVCAYQLEVTK